MLPAETSAFIGKLADDSISLIDYKINLDLLMAKIQRQSPIAPKWMLVNSVYKSLRTEREH